MAQKTKTIYRDSKTGQITDRKHAERSPSTTERERVRVSPPKSKR